MNGISAFALPLSPSVPTREFGTNWQQTQKPGTDSTELPVFVQLAETAVCDSQYTAVSTYRRCIFPVDVTGSSGDKMSHVAAVFCSCVLVGTIKMAVKNTATGSNEDKMSNVTVVFCVGGHDQNAGKIRREFTA